MENDTLQICEDLLAGPAFESHKRILFVIPQNDSSFVDDSPLFKFRSQVPSNVAEQNFGQKKMVLIAEIH